MQNDPDRHFRLFQKTGDPEWIGRVFDALAPRLLRLAIHLVGRAGEAEDLVQETFLVAIEEAQDFDPKREVTPWLSGILVNRARLLRRRAARDLDPDRLRERVTQTPPEELADAEFSGSLAKALDRLEEPYRRALVLRLRHGMTPADIAHVLDESPGTVRVRIHRGLEKLRRLLPAGLVSLAFLSSEPLRGLASIREQVLAEAGQAATFAGTTSLGLVGVLMTKKLVAAAVFVTALVAATTWYPWSGPALVEEDSDRGVNTAQLAMLGESPAKDIPLDSVASARSTPTRTVAAVGASPEIIPLVGSVKERESGEPIANALVELYAPETSTLERMKEEAWAFASQAGGNGALRVFGGWPTGSSESSLDMYATTAGTEREPTLFYGRVQSSAQPIAIARTNDKGQFRLLAPSQGGTLRCQHPDFTTIDLPAPDPKDEWAIQMEASKVLFGHVVDQSGKPVEEQIPLLFWGRISSRNLGRVSLIEGDGDKRLLRGNPEELNSTRESPAFDSWPVLTEPDGSFEITLPVDQVQLTVRASHLVAFPISFETGLDEPVMIRVRGAPCLHVIDSETGEGIERIFIRGWESGNGRPRFTGRFFAPGGRHPLIQEESLLRMFANKPHDLQVWAEGYRSKSVHVSDLASEGVIEVALERGERPTAEGLVMLDGEPLANALVALQAFYPLQWQSEEECTISARHTAEDGRFRLEVPAGRYLLRVSFEDRVCIQPIDLPGLAHYTIDFNQLGSIEVTVIDSDGLLQMDHPVVLGDASGRSDWVTTDVNGMVIFSDLADGDYRLTTPQVATTTSFYDGIQREVEIHGSASEAVNIEIPAAGEARFARVTTDTEASFENWRARTSYEDWVPIHGDGTIPIDLSKLSIPYIEIAEPNDRRWIAQIPADAMDGYAIQLVLRGPRYEGVLLDLATDRPLARTRVVARALGANNGKANLVAVITDAQGRFVLPCETSVPHRLTFNSDLSRRAFEGAYHSMKGLEFRTAKPPGQPEVLTIRLPRFGNGTYLGLGSRTLSGRVTDATSAEPVEGAQMFVRALQPGSDGTLEFTISAFNPRLGPDGRYEILLPDVEQYRIMLFAPNRGARLLNETWDALPGDSEVRDLVVRWR